MMKKQQKKWMSFRVSFDTIGQIDWQCSGWYGLDVNDGYDDERVGSLEPLDKIMSGWVEDTKHIYTWLVKAGRLK